MKLFEVDTGCYITYVLCESFEDANRLALEAYKRTFPDETVFCVKKIKVLSEKPIMAKE